MSSGIPWLDRQAVAAGQHLAAIDPALLTPTGRALQAVGVDTAFEAMTHGMGLTPRDCPECRNGKHANCTGWALDEDTDEVVDCDCASGGHL